MSSKDSQNPKVWLHIGMPKTGTTSVQSTLYANRGVLEQYGYFYPDFAERQHFPLVDKLVGELDGTLVAPNPGDWRQHARFTDLLDRHSMRGHTSIISSENFFLRPVATLIEIEVAREQAFDMQRKLVERTAAYFSGCDVTVLVWLRRQDRWLMSWYNEVVKTSMLSAEIGVFAQRPIGTDLFRLVNFWIEAFGRSRVVCRSYDALVGTGTSSLDDFVRTVCPDVPRESLKNSGVRENISFSNEALWLKRRINAALKRDGIEPHKAPNQKIRKLLDQITRTSAASGRPLLSLPERKSLMQRYLPGNRRLVEELGYEELRPLLDTADLDVPSDPAVSTSDEAFSMSCHCVDQMINAFILGK